MTFFRKYNKLLLAVGGSVLMVVFLIPQAGSLLQGKPTDRPVGFIGEHEFTIGHKRMASSELEVLNRMLGISMERIAAQVRATPTEDAQMRNAYISQYSRLANLQATLPSARGGEEDSDPALQWMLLIEEANRQGLYASQGEVESIIAELNVSRSEMLMAMRRNGLTNPMIDRSLRHFRMYLKLRSLTMASRRVSEPAIRKFARDYNILAQGMWGLRTGNMIEAQRVKIPADQAIDLISPVTDDELAKLFGEARQSLAGEGPYGFGYRYPARFQLEYMIIGREAIERSLGDLTDEAITWMARPENAAMLREQLAARSKQKKADGGEAPNPNKLPDIEPEAWDQMKLAERFEAFREPLMDSIKTQELTKRQREIVAILRRDLSAPLESVAKDEDGYYVSDGNLPAADFETIAEKINQKMSLLPKVVRIENRWMDADNLSSIDELDKAYLQLKMNGQTRNLSTAEYIASLKEALTEQTQTNITRHLKFQVGVPSALMADADESIIVFRVTAYKPSAAPAKLQEVREQVLADARKLKAYRKVQEMAGDLFLKTARTDGLERLAESLGEGVVEEFGGRFARRFLMISPGSAPTISVPNVPGLPVEADRRQYVDTLFDYVQQKLGGGADFESMATEDRFIAVPVDNQLAVYIVQIVDYDALDTTDIQTARPLVAQVIRNMDAYELARQGVWDPFSLKALKTRLGYKDYTGDEEKTDAQPSEPADPKEAAATNSSDSHAG